MTEPIVIAGALSAIAVVLAAVLPILANRSQVAFIKVLQSQLKIEREERVRLSTRVDDLDAKYDAAVVESGTLKLRTTQLEEWGRWTTADVPRTPPEWRH